MNQDERNHLVRELAEAIALASDRSKALGLTQSHALVDELAGTTLAELKGQDNAKPKRRRFAGVDIDRIHRTWPRLKQKHRKTTRRRTDG